MACTNPIPAYIDRQWQKDRDQWFTVPKIVLWASVETANAELPCGTCLGCRTSKATQWARRAEHEARTYDNNCFVTLTYNDEHLPKEGELEPLKLRAFIKRLRRAADRRHRHILTDARYSVRYLACGEYGSIRQRPHYHLLLFNCGFADSIQVGADLYESDTLSKLWPFGLHRIGTVTGASANYVAQYSQKGLGHLYWNDDGVILPAPFLRMSKVPILGYYWLQKFKSDLQHGYLVNAQGRKERIPRAYLRALNNGPQPDRLLAEAAKQGAARAAPRRAPHAERQKQHEAEHIIHQRKRELSRTLKHL